MKKVRTKRAPSRVMKAVKIGEETRLAQSGGDFFTLLVEQQLGARCLRELQFDAKRKFRFDYALPDYKLAIEIDGGIWKQGGGRHNRASGWLVDQEKMNLAVSQGWRILHFTPQQQNTMATLELIRSSMRFRSEEIKSG
jgi:very-short-patch-repair endonuclease